MTVGNIAAKCAQEPKLNFFLGTVQAQKWMATMTGFLVKATQGFSNQMRRSYLLESRMSLTPLIVL